MLTDSLKNRVLTNPALGLLPYLVFSILIGQIGILYAFAVGFGLSIAPLLFRARKELRILYDISAWSFLITVLALFVIVPDFQPQRSFILAEVILVFSLMIFRLSRKSLMRKVGRKQKSKSSFYFYESLQVSFQSQYALTVHLIFLLGFGVFFGLRYPVVNTVIALNLFQIIIVIIIVLEAFRLRLLNNRLQSEEWLPVISESGVVQGRVAKSVSVSMKNKFLHPIIRIALIYDGMLYLKERDHSRLLDPEKLDYPFETYMQYKHNIEKAIKNVVKKEIKKDALPVRFILKYVFENERTKRLIFLYVSTINSEEEFNNLSLEGGKLWTTNQIEDNIGSSIFSETFELEFDYLKNTVLMSDLAIRKSQ
mgnify:CR=1 FL=1